MNPSRQQGWQLAWFVVPFTMLTLLSVASALFGVHQHNFSGFADALFPSLTSGRDLSGFHERFQFYGSAKFFQTGAQHFGDYQSFNYAAPLAVIAHLLFLAPMDAVVLFRAILITWLLVLAGVFVAASRRQGAQPLFSAVLAVAVLTLSLPVVLLGYTANLEMFVWLATGTGVWIWFAGREKSSAALFGLAAAMKYYPLALLGLFASRRHWIAFALGSAVFAAAMLAGMLLLGPDLSTAWHGLQTEVARFGQHYLLHWQRTDNGYDHSIFGVVKLVVVASGHEAALPAALRVYVLSASLALPLFYWASVRHLDGLDQVIALNLLCIWVTPMSQDYTLVHLLVPFGCLLLDRMRCGCQSGDRARLTYFAMLFAAMSFIHLGPARLGGNVKSVVLGLLLLATSRRRTDVESAPDMNPA